MIEIKRTKTDEYQLIKDESVVETYNQTKMTHPYDWITDAQDAGASQKEIDGYNFVDDR